MSLQVFGRLPPADPVRPRIWGTAGAIVAVSLGSFSAFDRGLGPYLVAAAAYCLLVLVALFHPRLAVVLVLVCYTLPVLSTNAVSLPTEARLGALPFVFLLVCRAAMRPACKPSRANIRLQRLLAVVALLAMASGLWSPNPVGTVEAAGGVVLVWLTLWAMSRLMTPRETVGILWPFLVVVVLASASVTITGLLLAPGGASGIFENPNTLGLMCVLTLPFCLERGRAGVLIGIVALWLMFESASRASALAAVVGLLYVAFLLRQRSARVAAWMLGFALVGLLVNGLLVERVGETASKSMLVTMDTRSRFWEVGMEAARAHPLTGVGFGTGTLAFDGANSYISMLAALGVSGLVVVVLLFPLVVWPTLRVRRTTVYGAVVIGGLVNAVFEAWLFSGGTILAVFYWIVVGMCLQEEGQPPAGRAVPDRATHPAADAGARRVATAASRGTGHGALLPGG